MISNLSNEVLNQVFDALEVDSLAAARRKLAELDPTGDGTWTLNAMPERCGCDESLHLRAQLRVVRVALTVALEV